MKLKSKIAHYLWNQGYGYYKVPESGRLDSIYFYRKRLFDSIKDIDGDVVECGIGHGFSFSTIVGLAASEGKERKVWGFDSFEGFPEPSVHDKSPRNPQKGEWKVSTPESISKLLLDKSKIDQQYIDNNVKFVKGFFKDSLSQYNGQIAFLHLDVDLYESYKVCLETLWPRVADGGVVMFDEYKSKKHLIKWPGASKAIDEFFGDIKRYIRYDSYADRYYIYKQI